MDWGKAKTVLILAFLVLNSLLAYQLWSGNRELTEAGTETVSYTEQLRRSMADKQISISVPIPEETPKLREITVQFDTLTKPDQFTSLANPLKSSLLSESKLPADLIKAVPRVELYQLDPAQKTDNMLVMNQLYGQYPMFDVQLQLLTQNEQIYAYRSSHVEVYSNMDRVEQKVLPAYKAIGSLVDNYLQNNTIINDIRLGYHGQIFNSETQVLAPFWRISTDSGDLYYVHAINGAVEVLQRGQ